MKTINIDELRPGSYINLDGEIITLEQAKEIITKGQTPNLYTVSDNYIHNALMSMSKDRIEGKETIEDYCEEDPDAMKIIYPAHIQEGESLSPIQEEPMMSFITWNETMLSEDAEFKHFNIERKEQMYLNYCNNHREGEPHE